MSAPDPRDHLLQRYHAMMQDFVVQMGELQREMAYIRAMLRRLEQIDRAVAAAPDGAPVQ